MFEDSAFSFVVTDCHQSAIKKTYTNAEGTVTLVENEYDELGKVTRSVDNAANVVYTYSYDRRGNVTEERRNGSTFKAIEYDESNRLTKTTVTPSDEMLVYTPIYETNSANAIYPDNALKDTVLEGPRREVGLAIGMEANDVVATSFAGILSLPNNKKTI